MEIARKKKLSLGLHSKGIKRENENNDQKSKRTKSENEHSLKSRNFIRACELVTQKAHEDLCNRFQLLHLPVCINNCKHIGSKTQIHQIVSHAEKVFMVEMASNKWYEALEVCFLNITEKSYLSDNVLKNIIEIMMNAHEDQSTGYSISHLISKCQQVLSMNIQIHPPCSFEPVRKCYLNFLIAPMDLRQNTLTNRSEFGSKSGIFQYCINRLEYELSVDSKDEPLFDKEMCIPQDIRHTIQGVHWVKSRLEIFEMLKRSDRIDRLMVVLDSLTEFIGFDLAIYHSRLLKGEVGMRRQKILITAIFQLNDLKMIEEMNDTCKQIMKIFIYFIHLNYPEKYIKTMNFWVNTLIETLYTAGKQITGAYKSLMDFHKIERKCRNFALTFHEIMSELPPESVTKVLERLTPTYMRYLVGILHCEKLLSGVKSSIIMTLIDFIDKSQWKNFPKSKIEVIKRTENARQLTPDNILKHLIKITKDVNSSSDNNNRVYKKFKPVNETFENDQAYVTQVLYITVKSYLDSYHLHKMQKTLDKLNKEASENQSKVSPENHENIYSYATQDSVKIYRSIYNDLKKYFYFIQNFKSKRQLPKILDIFENIFDLREL